MAFSLEPYLPLIKKLEGYTPRAKWDYKQYSSGYGTKGVPGEVVTPEMAESRFRSEMDQAAAHVDRFAPNLPDGKRAALASLTQNAGPGWKSNGLGQAIKAGDWTTAEQRFGQYNKVTNPDGTMSELPGLTNRRRTELSWWRQPGQSPIVPALRDPGVAPAEAPIAQPQQTFATDKSIDASRELGTSFLAHAMTKRPEVTTNGAAGWMQGLAHVADKGVTAWLGRQWMEQARSDEAERDRSLRTALQGAVAPSIPSMGTSTGTSAGYTSAAPDAVMVIAPPAPVVVPTPPATATAPPVPAVDRAAPPRYQKGQKGICWSCYENE